MLHFKHHKEWLTTPIAIIIAGALIAIGIYLGALSIASKGGTASKPATAQVAPVKIKPVTTADHVMGNPNAKVVIVEYSDTECPYCKSLHATLNRLVAAYGKEGSVAWVYRHYPIDRLHSKARKQAEASECAAELGGTKGFWEFLNELYAITPSNNGLDPAELPKIAKKVGLDVAKFETCLSSGKYTELIDAQIKDALAAGAKGTPYSVVITKSGTIPLKGAVSYESLESLLKSNLK
jgi:protein-disulfide isomerase